MSSRVFPASFPELCPPSDADPANGDFFRLVSSVPPTDKDFKTYRELGLRPDEDICIRCGLTVYPKAHDAAELYHHMRRSYPDVRIGTLVACLKLSPADGVIKQTRKFPHHTWWAFKGVERISTYAEIVMDLEQNVGD